MAEQEYRHRLTISIQEAARLEAMTFDEDPAVALRNTRAGTNVVATPEVSATEMAAMLGRRGSACRMPDSVSAGEMATMLSRRGSACRMPDNVSAGEMATMLGRRGSACRSERLPPGATDTGGGALAGPPAGLTPLRNLPPSALPAPGRLPPPSANVLRAEDDERERIKPYRI